MGLRAKTAHFAIQLSAFSRERQLRVLASCLSEIPASGSWQAALRDVDEVAVGIHYGRYDRVDFVLYSENDGSIERLLAQGQLVRASLTSVKDFHVARVPADQNRIRGSLTVRATELDSWLKSVGPARSPQTTESNQ